MAPLLHSSTCLQPGSSVPEASVAALLRNYFKVSSSAASLLPARRFPAGP